MKATSGAYVTLEERTTFVHHQCREVGMPTDSDGNKSFNFLNVPEESYISNIAIDS